MERYVINRREFLAGSLMLAGYAAMGGSNVFALTVNDAKVKSVRTKITCTMEVLKPLRNKNINIWTPIPPDDSEQKISGLSVKSRMQYKMTEDTSNKNRMFFFSTDKLTAGETITMKYTMVRKTADVVEDRDERPERHLEPSEWERWDDKIARYVDELVGKESDPVRIGRKIYDALIDSLNYVHEACGRGVSTLMFEEKIGRCDEFHALFRSMMMYKKIPVKWEQGIALPYPSVIKKSGEVEADCINAHSWIKFHIGDNKWMPVDLSEAKRRPDLRDFYFGRLAANRIKMSNGRGITLNPPQKSPMNTFPYAYAEADGIPLIYGHNYKNRMKYEVVKIEV